MSNLIPLEDAARMLGLSIEKLNEMRSNSEIFGYKDGTSWKFKMQELERVADEFDIKINTSAASDAADEVINLEDDEFDISLDDDDDDALDFDLDDSAEDLVNADASDADDEIVSLVEDDKEIVDLADDDEDDIIDLGDDDEFDLKIDDDETDIVVEEEPVAEADADDGVIEIADEEPVAVTEADDEVVEIADDDDDFDLGLADEADDSTDLLDLADESKEEVAEASGDNDSSELLDLADDVQEKLKFEDDSADILDVSDEEPAAQEPEDLSFGSSDISLAADDGDSGDLLLDDEPGKGDPSTGKLLGGDDDEGELLLSEDDLFEDDLEIQESHEDSIDLSSDFEDSDLIMEDSDSSAEIVGEESSGMLLEDSSEIDMSGGLMELAGADDDEDEMIVLEDPASNDAPTELGDDDFNLTPLEEVIDEESSGSQIIALEDSDMFSDDSAATLLSPSDEMEAEPMLTDDGMGVDDFGGFDAGAGMAPGMAITPGSTGALPEQPYTVWQVVSLGLVLTLLAIGGMIGYDLARNLWLPADQTISSGVLPTILDLVGLRS